MKNALLARPYILVAIQQGIVNYSALAKLLHADIEKMAGRKFTEISVKMAVLRVSKSLLEAVPPTHRLSRVLANSSLKVVQDVGVLSVTREGFEKLTSFLPIGSRGKTPQLFHVVQGASAVTVIADEPVVASLYSKASPETVLQYLRNQAAVILTGPPEILTTPGVVSLISLSVAVRGVNLTEIVSCHRDIVLIVNGSDVALAFETLRSLVEFAKTEQA